MSTFSHFVPTISGYTKNVPTQKASAPRN